jgi:hypothetical protein
MPSTSYLVKEPLRFSRMFQLLRQLTYVPDLVLTSNAPRPCSRYLVKEASASADCTARVRAERLDKLDEEVAKLKALIEVGG